MENINADLQNIFSINELKLSLILFADGQVRFATSPNTLQLLLSDLETYSQHWSLKINTNKTKAMIFEKGRQATYFEFYIYGTAIEIVDHIKYLGVKIAHKNAYHNTRHLLYINYLLSSRELNCRSRWYRLF